MRTFQQILSVYIGENAYVFSTNFNDLPCHVLESILPYLSAEKLHEIHSMSKTRGIDFDKYWREHIRKRWRRKLLSTMNVFQDLEQDCHLFYLMQHFHDLLDIYTTTPNASERGRMLIHVHSMFTCPLHQLCSRMSSGFSTTQIPDCHQSELFKYARYIQTLRVTGAQCDWIYNHPDLLTILLNITDRIQVVPVTETYYCGILKLLSTLMVHGRLKTTVFSACKLSEPYLKDLMSVVSGNTEHLRLGITSLNKSPRNPETNSASFASFSQDSNNKDQCHQQTDSSADEDIDLYLSEDECTSEPVAWSTTVVSELSKVQDPNNLFDEALIPMNSSSGIKQTSKQKSNITCSGYNLVSPVPVYHHMTLECQNCQILQQKSRMKISSETFCNKTSSKVTDGKEQGPEEKTSFNQRKEKGVWRGLESFAMFGVTKRSDISKALLNSLPTWNSLTKLGISDLDIQSEITVDEIMKMISSHHLSHLVLDNLYLPRSFFTKLVFTLHNNYRKRDAKGPAIELLDIQSLSSIIVYDNSLPEDIALMGVKTLDLSMNTLDDSAIPGLLHLLRNDQALLDLRLKCCGLSRKNLSQLLDTLSANKILSLNLTGNFIQTERVEAALLNFMQRCISLRTLVLENTNLRTEFVGSSCFLETLVNHPSLTTLSVANNNLENAAVEVLKGVCCTDCQIGLKSLDIGYNRIKGETLLEAAEYLRTYVKKGPVLAYLNISSNQITCTVKERLHEILEGIVKEIEAEVVELTQPFAEYIALM